MEPHEHQPDEPASRAGRYDELNVFGTPTGRVSHVGEGEELPKSPRGFSWRHARAGGQHLNKESPAAGEPTGPEAIREEKKSWDFTGPRA
jgi:hypothetical protein